MFEWIICIERQEEKVREKKTREAKPTTCGKMHGGEI